MLQNALQVLHFFNVETKRPSANNKQRRTRSWANVLCPLRSCRMCAGRVCPTAPHGPSQKPPGRAGEAAAERAAASRA
eukprot:217218-Prymnesium_polylepis.1